MARTTNPTAIKKGDRSWKPVFLEELQAKGEIAAAARAVQINRRTIYEARDRDPDFAAALQDATSYQVENVEDTLYSRAIGGSDTAIIFFLKMRKPEVYGERLKADEVEQIRAPVRRQVLAELRAELGELKPAARKLLMSAVPSA